MGGRFEEVCDRSVRQIGDRPFEGRVRECPPTDDTAVPELRHLDENRIVSKTHRAIGRRRPWTQRLRTRLSGVRSSREEPAHSSPLAIVACGEAPVAIDRFAVATEVELTLSLIHI